MGKSKKIAIENYQKFQSVAHWSHRSEKIKDNWDRTIALRMFIAKVRLAYLFVAIWSGSPETDTP